MRTKTSYLASLLTPILLVLLVAATLATQGTRASPGILYVSTSGSDANDCTAAGPPCRTVQRAINLATTGDEIHVATGTYTGTAGTVAAITKTVTLLGGWDNNFATRDPSTYPTTLDAQSQGRVVQITGIISPTIDGFVITGGKGPDGGGVHIHDASPIIQNNIITANLTITNGSWADGRGGGIFAGGTSNAVIAGNLILSNTSGYGGGIYHDASMAITVTANRIAGNFASSRGGGFLVEGAPDIVRANVISGNTAAEDGGGMLIWDAAPQVEANRIVGNSAAFGGGITLGNNATPSLLNNLVISNTQDGLRVRSSSPLVVHNTIVGSGLTNSGHGISLGSSPDCNPPYCTTGDIINNIVTSYEVGISGTGPITPVIDYNDVWGNSTADYSLPPGVAIGTHNISLDPLFVDPVDEDYHLQAGSPCIDAGTDAGVTTDIDGRQRPMGAGYDIGADEYAWLGLDTYLPLIMKNY